jgi:hypothetical protein
MPDDDKKKICAYISKDTIDAVTKYAELHNTTKSAVYERAVEALTDGPDTLALMVKRLDALERKLDGNSRDFESISEMLFALAYYLFLFQPALPKKSKDPAKRRAKRRLEHWEELVTNGLRESSSFLDTVKDAATHFMDFDRTGT